LVALEQAGNELMGRPLKYIIEDGGTDVNVSMDKARKLVEVDKVRVIIGPIFASAQDAIGGYVNKVPIPLITIAASQNVQVIQTNWTFLASATCESNGYPTGLYAAEKLGYRTAVTLASDFVAGHEYIGGFVQGFKEKGGNIIQQQWYPPGTTNMVPFLIAAKRADCLVTWWPGADSFAGFKQYKELKINMPIIQPQDGGITANPAVNKRLGDAIVGVHTSVVYTHVANTSGNKEFVERYSKKWGALPGANCGAAFVSTQIALEAIKRAGHDSSPGALKSALINLSMDTVHGQVSFNKDRIATYITPIVKIDNNLDSQIVAEYRIKAERVGDKIVSSVAK
jgi:branched-chain amino acid transport system substrate-binding protein